MNCVTGDMAIVVDCYLGNEWTLGKIVRCLAPATCPWTHQPGWLISPSLSDGFYGGGIRDRCLRPIRDQSGEDETLRWSEVPKEHA